MKGIPILFGEIAIREGYIDEDILKKVLKYQQQLPKKELIGEILLKQGYVTKEIISRILKIQHKFKTKLENEYFIHVALKKKILTHKKVWELRKLFLEQESKGGTTIPSLAVTHNFISMMEVEEVLKSKEYQLFTKLKREGKTAIGKYELIGNIIKLKKATIYKALQIELDRLIAIKILHKEYETREYIRNFFKEARLTAKFNHPNLVRVYDIGVDNDKYFYAMEVVEGENLKEKLAKEGRLQKEDALRIIIQIAQALEYIHTYKYIHGKINPRNIAIREDGIAKLLDLSFATSIEKEKVWDGRMSKMPQYMAPEQIHKKSPISEKTDIYSLGATFYEIITGNPPIKGKNIDEIKNNILNYNPPPVKEIDHTISEDLSNTIERMMRKDPQKRYKNMKFLIKKLEKVKRYL